MKRKVMNKAYGWYSKLVRLTSFRGFAPLPRLIIWELTYRCNLRCKMCPYYGPGGKVPEFKDELSFEEIQKIFLDIKKSYKLFLPRIHLIGGEPLIHKDFSKIAEFLKKLGFSYSLTTNFTLVSDSVVETLVQYPPSDLRISLDGPREIHDRIRGVAGTFDRVIRNFEKLRKSNSRIPVRFNCTICPDNVDYLAEMIKIANETNAELNFQHLMFIDDKHINQHYLFFDEVFACKPSFVGCKDSIPEEGIAKTISEIKDIKEGDTYVTFLPDLEVSEIKDYYLNMGHYTHSPYCSEVWATARIEPNGMVYPCYEYFFGDLKKNSFNKVWNGKKARRFREILKKRRLFPGCIRCCKI